MSPPDINCVRCRTPLPFGMLNQPAYSSCPACGLQLRAEVFPALFRSITVGASGEPIVTAEESSCFYHPQKKAVLPCDGCGRFLCALCDCELHGKHFCPTCLEVGKTKGKIKNLENRRTLWDSIALSVAVLPMLLVFTFYFTFMTAPMALYIAIRYWNAPRSIVHATRIRYVLAILVAGAQIVGWAVALYVIFAVKHQ